MQDAGDKLDQLCEKRECITYSQGEKVYPTYNNKNEG